MYVIFCCYFFILLPRVEAATEKQLDNFSASTFGYYYIYNLTAAVSSSHHYEGGSSLQVFYSLSSGAYGEVFRSYGTNTLDLSFFPDYLSLYVRGQATQHPQFRFMLYEDNDMDGNPFESGEDIFEFTNNTILSNTVWTEVVMPYSSFTKFGGGTGTLNLNRIYAWRIYLYNPTASPITGTVYFDNLRQYTTYTPPAHGNAKINGAFLQLWNDATCGACGTWSVAEWEQQFNYMKEVCIDQIVIQYSVWTNVAWYTPSGLSGVTSFPAINRIFTAAQNTHMKVYVGLYFDGEFDEISSANAAYYALLNGKNVTVIDDLWTLFGSSPAFEGWYIPQEIHDLYWQNSSDRNLLANWLQNIASYAKSKNSSKKVMIAPYFGPWKPADVVQSWYNDFLSSVPALDIVALQDGVGTFANWGMGPPLTKDPDVDVPHYFAAVKNACLAHGKIFAADIESFTDPDPRTPASITRLKSQIWEAYSHTNLIFQFAWLYMQPGFSAASQALYEQYKLYASCAHLPMNSYKHIYNLLDNYVMRINADSYLISRNPHEIIVYDYCGKKIPCRYENNILTISENFPNII
ncbi:MAG: DUF4434 domain-containing protein, partial [Cytophagaceae bacterium]|nr:DUF4434 domain-containing protein [Cytophagaceae bacterium]MDW8455225.1 DUF4434 domain-containing protein [Cytophagaceae bacterium]